MACLLVGASLAATAQTGYYMVPHLYGPGNPGGYNTDDEYPSGGGMVAGWSTLAGGTATTPSWSGVQNLPFLFEFNGTAVFQFKVSTAGVLTFDVASTVNPAYGNVTLPSANIPDQSIVVLGSDASGANDFVVTKTFGPAGHQQMWIQFNSYTVIGQPTCWSYWAIVLEEGSNNIYIVDQRYACATTTSFSVGVQIDGSTAVAPSALVNALGGTDAGAASNNYYAFLPGTRPALGLKMATIDLQGFAYINASTTLSGRVVNTGTTAITSATINYKVGTAATVSSNLTGLNLASNAMAPVTHPTAWTATSAGTFNVKMWLSNINGGGTNSDTVSKDVAVISSVISNLAVFEHFTNASCAPCAAQNPAFTAMLNNNKTKATSIKHHVSWPGVDPMYSANTTDPTARVTYYGVGGVPEVHIGTVSTGPTGVTQNMIDQQYNNLLDAWNYTLETSITGQNLAITGNVVANRTLTQTDHVLHVAVVEDPINYATAPGTNGEKDFESVLRKLLPSAAGTTLGAGATATPVTLNYTLPANFNKDRIFVVVFVQSAGSKIVYKGAKIKAGASLATTTQVLDANRNSSSVYPNPVADMAQLNIELKQTSKVRMEVKNLLGQTMKSVDLGTMEAGVHQQIADLNELTGGMYLLQLQIGNEVHTHRIIKQ